MIANPVLWFVQHGLWELKQHPGADLAPAWREGYVEANRTLAAAVVEELDRAAGRAGLRPGLPPLPRAGLRSRSAARGTHRALHAHPLGRPRTRGRCSRATSPTRSTKGCSRATAPASTPSTGAPPSSTAAARLLDRGGDAERVSHCESHRRGRRGVRCARRRRRCPRAAGSARGRAPRDPCAPRRSRRPLEERGQGLRGVRAPARACMPALDGRIGLLALLDPSREEIPEYVDYRAAIERAADEVNERFARPGWTPVSLVVRDDFLASIAAYLEYDVLLVNPVMDGLNLVAKEAPLVNERDGVLVLSRGGGRVRGARRVGRPGRSARRRGPGGRARARDRASEPICAGRGSRASSARCGCTTWTHGPTASSASSTRAFPGRVPGLRCDREREPGRREPRARLDRPGDARSARAHSRHTAGGARRGRRGGTPGAGCVCARAARGPPPPARARRPRARRGRRRDRADDLGRVGKAARRGVRARPRRLRATRCAGMPRTSAPLLREERLRFPQLVLRQKRGWLRYEPLGVVGIVTPVELPARDPAPPGRGGGRRRERGDRQAVGADAALGRLGRGALPTRRRAAGPRARRSGRGRRRRGARPASRHRRRGVHRLRRGRPRGRAGGGRAALSRVLELGGRTRCSCSTTPTSTVRSRARSGASTRTAARHARASSGSPSRRVSTTRSSSASPPARASCGSAAAPMPASSSGRSSARSSARGSRASSRTRSSTEHASPPVAAGRSTDLPGWFSEPTLLLGEPRDARLVGEELFGPAAIVVEMDTDEAMVRWANDSPFGLGASVWTGDRARARAIADRLETGCVWHNDHAYSFGASQTPWGGRRGSGLGRTGSRHGLLCAVAREAGRRRPRLADPGLVVPVRRSRGRRAAGAARRAVRGRCWSRAPEPWSSTVEGLSISCGRRSGERALARRRGDR